MIYALIKVDLDRYFLLHLLMDLLLLKLNCRSLWGNSIRTATRKRVWIGALSAALCSLATVWIPGSFLMKQGIGTLLGLYVMAGICFGKWWGRGILTHLKNMICYGFLLGAVLAFLLKTGLRQHLVSKGLSNSRMLIFLLTAIVAYDLISFLDVRRKSRSNLCRVSLSGEDGRHITTCALMDTGNSLKEPISGKPVAIIDIDLLSQYYKGTFPQGFRAIPFHSVGCNTGILRGYRIPEMILETEGICYKIYDAYAAVGENILTKKGKYGMIVSPDFLKEE